MRKAKALASALLAAVIAPTFISTLYFLSMAVLAALYGATNRTEIKMGTMVFMVALTISAAHVVLLGLPAVLLLEKFNRLYLWSVALAGFVAGCLPMSIWSWPVDLKYKAGYTYWNGKEMVSAKINGIPTLVGWIDYLQGVAITGFLGLAAALSFWWIWKHVRPDELQKQARESSAPLT